MARGLLRRGAREPMHGEHHRLAPGAVRGSRGSSARGSRRDWRRPLRACPLQGPARPAGRLRRGAPPPTCPASSARRTRVHMSSVEMQAVRRQRVEERRAAFGLVPADEPQRARLASARPRDSARMARLQRVAGELEIVVDDMRQLLIEDVPLLVLPEKLQPVDAQSLRKRRIAVAGRGKRALRPGTPDRAAGSTASTRGRARGYGP